MRRSAINIFHSVRKICLAYCDNVLICNFKNFTQKVITDQQVDYDKIDRILISSTVEPRFFERVGIGSKVVQKPWMCKKWGGKHSKIKVGFWGFLHVAFMDQPDYDNGCHYRSPSRIDREITSLTLSLYLGILTCFDRVKQNNADLSRKSSIIGYMLTSHVVSLLKLVNF
ncbi:hypothetical protein BDC45DRAFT_533643 [Circinella umbellata]|nr:hypothetical protein BDC45DRAFT_533643 [Circinella umbellata]